MKSLLSSTVQLSLLVLAGLLFVRVGVAQTENTSNAREQRVTTQAQAVSRRVFEKIQQAQQLVESASASNLADALDLLTATMRSGNLSEYEKEKILQQIGFIHYSMENIDAAIATYDEILRLPSLESETRKHTIYTLAQLHAALEQYHNASDLLEQWFELEANPAPDSFVFYAQVLYQTGRVGEMIEPLESAIRIAKSRRRPVREDWYKLLSYAYFQQENYERVRDIHKLLVANWPSKQYWISLSGSYSELGELENSFAAFDLVHTQGLLESESELVMMAQLYLQNDVPYKAATLLETEMNNGRVAPTASNYRLLSQAWSLAQEDERAIPALVTAASMSDDGELDLRLANAYLNLGRYAECVSAVRKAIEKGGLRNSGSASISLGICQYNLQQYERADDAFREAIKTPALASVADQWLSVIELDVKRNKEIAAAEEAARNTIRLLASRREAISRQ